jgi:PKD repeat protein
MRKFIRFSTASSLGLLFAWAAGARLAAQLPGEVLWHQKISAAKGNGPHNLRVNDQFGRAAAAIGDVDGDGVCDLAVGALGDDDPPPGLMADDTLQYGACWILFMNRDGTVKDHYKISRSSGGLPLDPGDEWGRAVRELGDWDLDGVPDVMVGTCYDDDNGTDKGAFYLLFLNRDGSVKSWRKISELAGGFTGDLDPDDQFGRGLRVLGDLDLDGVPEIGVGSIRDDDGGRNRGAYWVLFMRRDGTVRSYTKLSETSGGFQNTLSDYGEFGFDCAVLGDRDGDGVQDIAICAPDQKTDGLQQGAVFVVHLNRNGTSKSDFRIAENYAGLVGDMLDYNDEFGCSIDALGDVDRDGIGDIAVGAGKDDDGPSGSFDRGALYVLFLNANATVKGWQKLSRASGRFYGQIDNADRFGTSLACPGDLNLDGIPDLFAGVRFDDDGGSAAGCEYFVALNDGTLVPPVAKFAYTPFRGKAPLSVQFSDQSTGNVTGWEWDFGDGTTSNEQHPQYVYTTTGIKSVTLTVRGPAGSHQRLRTNIIRVDPPVAPLAGFEGTPVFGMAPLAVQFTDTSFGLVRSRAWDFGDGAASAEPSPSHVYSAAGRYTVALTVANETGTSTATRVEYVVATDVPPPVAGLAADVVAGVSPLTVQFIDLSAGDVTSWSWDFGDGATSAEPSPAHTYLAAGLFTVALTVGGPGGTDTRIEPDLVSVALPPAPVAAFTASATNGIDPLAVSFTDESSGVITSWAWSFGDGATSTQQHATHDYLAPGAFTVVLTVSGPGGSDELALSDLVQVHSVTRGLLDPSFEEQAPPGLLAGPWSVFGGLEQRVEPAMPGATDGPFPGDGAQWLLLSSAGTSFALPPATPGAATTPASGGAGVAQDFYLEDPLSVLTFDAAFVRGDALDPDWMSVDVSDGVTTVNLFFADAATPAPEFSDALGLPRTATERVRASLRELFPDSWRNTRFTLTLQVGNGGEDLSSSFGLFDDFRLEQAPATALRYGCDPAVRGTLRVLSGEPRIGTTLTLGVDNPLGTQGPNSRAYVWVSRQSDLGYPCGTWSPSFGMSAAGAPGEILVDRTAGILLKTTLGGLWSTPGTPAPVPVTMPTSLAWIGQRLYVQGYLVDSRSTYGVRTAVTDALELLLGP